MLQEQGQIETMITLHELMCSKDKTVSATHLFYKSDQSLPRPYLLTSTLKPPPVLMTNFSSQTPVTVLNFLLLGHYRDCATVILSLAQKC